MLMTYKEDMLAALDHLACLKGISTSYEDQSLEAQKRASKQNEARRKRRAKDDDGEGPPNKQRDFQGMYVCMYKMHAQLTLQSVLHSLVLRPIYGKRVHTTAVVLYMNTVSYLVADAKKPKKQRKLNVANEKENSDTSKPQDKLQIESKSSTSDSSKINIKAK